MLGRRCILGVGMVPARFYMCPPGHLLFWPSCTMIIRVVYVFIALFLEGSRLSPFRR